MSGQRENGLGHRPGGPGTPGTLGRTMNNGCSPAGVSAISMLQKTHFDHWLWYFWKVLWHTFHFYRNAFASPTGMTNTSHVSHDAFAEALGQGSLEHPYSKGAYTSYGVFFCALFTLYMINHVGYSGSLFMVASYMCHPSPTWARFWLSFSILSSLFKRWLSAFASPLLRPIVNQVC